MMRQSLERSTRRDRYYRPTPILREPSYWVYRRQRTLLRTALTYGLPILGLIGLLTFLYSM